MSIQAPFESQSPEQHTACSQSHNNDNSAHQRTYQMQVGDHHAELNITPEEELTGRAKEDPQRSTQRPEAYGVKKIADVMKTSDDSVRIRYRADISPDWPMCQVLCCGPCFSDKLLKRTYVQVHENRIETNYPILCCCGTCVCDRVRATYFDRSGGHFASTRYCTPFHCCGAFESCGQVVKDPICECCESSGCNIPCGCLSRWYPGLYDGAAVASEAKAAYQDWLESKARAKQ